MGGETLGVDNAVTALCRRTRIKDENGLRRAIARKEGEAQPLEIGFIAGRAARKSEGSGVWALNPGQHHRYGSSDEIIRG